MKKTNREMFVALLAVVTNANLPDTDIAEMTDFINSRIEQIDKKATTITPSKAKAQAEKEAFINTVLDALAKADRPVKVSTLIAETEALSGMTTQKITPVLTSLVNEGKVERMVVKKDKLYSIKTA